MSELAWGQVVAIGLGAVFFGCDYLRFKRVRFAALEGVRLWAVIAGSEIAIWLAVRSSDAPQRIGIAALAPLVIALLVNNAYVALHRAMFKDVAA